MTDDHTELIIRELARIDQFTADAALKRREFERGGLKFWISAVAAAAALLNDASPDATSPPSYFVCIGAV